MIRLVGYLDLASTMIGPYLVSAKKQKILRFKLGTMGLSSAEEDELRDSVTKMAQMVGKYRSKVDGLTEELEEVS